MPAPSLWGRTRPCALGDYVAGPSHVLPTGATARFASGLSSNDFLRADSVIHFTHAGLEAIADDVLTMARKEGLTGHARSVEMRLTKSNHSEGSTSNTTAPRFCSCIHEST